MQGLIAVCIGVLFFTGMELLAREMPASATVRPGSKPTPAGSASATAAEPGAAPASITQNRSNATDVPVYWIWLRLTFASLASAAAIIYYARWQNAWAQRHADAEFQLQQFHLDVNRANWVIETCLEWKKETSNAVIPAELLSSLTRNLFQDPRGQAEQVLHPADELASAILGTASHLKLRTDGAEIDIEKPGKRVPKKTTAAAPAAS
jgi:hypothetical protein